MIELFKIVSLLDMTTFNNSMSQEDEPTRYFTLSHSIFEKQVQQKEQ